jgi:sugar O-acyltransferase (sialic acid O-acetyltransferase NeuD family)
MNKRLAIIGSSDLGQLIAHHASLLPDIEVVGYYDDIKKEGEHIGGLQVLGKINKLRSDFSKGVFDALMVGIGYKHMAFRASVYNEFSKEIPFAKVIHPSASIDPSVKIGNGCFILPGCVLDRNVELEDNVLLNTGVVIAHDSHVGSHSFVSPAVKIAGFTKIGSGCVLGIGSVIIDNLTLTDHVITGAGSLVLKSLSIPGVYYGSPVKWQRNER